MCPIFTIAKTQFCKLGWFYQKYWTKFIKHPNCKKQNKTKQKNYFPEKWNTATKTTNSNMKINVFELNGTHFIHITRFLPKQLNNVGHDGKALSSLGYTGFVDTLTCSWNLYFFFFTKQVSATYAQQIDRHICMWVNRNMLTNSCIISPRLMTRSTKSSLVSFESCCLLWLCLYPYLLLGQVAHTVYWPISQCCVSLNSSISKWQTCDFMSDSCI